VTVYSRRGTDLTQRFSYVGDALASLPDEIVIDGELVALMIIRMTPDEAYGRDRSICSPALDIHFP
jgi:hypothetical protein